MIQQQKRLLIIGATGSLGTQLLEIISRYPNDFQVVGMMARKNAEQLMELSERFKVDKLYLSEGSNELDRFVKHPVDLLQQDIDQVFFLDHGLQNYHLVLEALSRRIPVAMANKELMVVHGQDIMYLAQEQQVEFIPLDSEHNAIFQAIGEEKIGSVRRVMITASGGPFREKSWDDLSSVTVKEVLNHPTWKMGAKTTVDSATLVNKAYEVIEAMNLFGLSFEQVEVRLHHQSIVHALVELTDGTTKLVAYAPNMRYPLGHALFFPGRAQTHLVKGGSLFEMDQPLHFGKIEPGRFPCFDFVMEVAQERPELLGQLVENDERIVKDFLNGEVGFHDILEGLKEGIL